MLTFRKHRPSLTISHPYNEETAKVTLDSRPGCLLRRLRIASQHCVTHQQAMKLAYGATVDIMAEAGKRLKKVMREEKLIGQETEQE